MPTLETSNGYTILLDPVDFVCYNGLCWRVGSDGLVKYNYRVGHTITSVNLARLITEAPPDKRVRYINGNRLDCRRENLILVDGTTHRLLSAKPSSSKTSQYRGVSRDTTTPRTDCWRASLKVSGMNHTIGQFRTEEAAARAYDTYVTGLFGLAAYTNFVMTGA